MIEKPRKYKRHDAFKFGDQVAIVQYTYSAGYNCKIGCCRFKSFTEEELDKLEKIPNASEATLDGHPVLTRNIREVATTS